MLRPLHFRSNCEDVVHEEAAVAALSPRYGAIRAPTEIVTGDSDGVVSAHIHSVGCARDIAGAQLTTLPGVGHSPHHVAPDRVVEIVLDAERRASERRRRLRRRGSVRAILGVSDFKALVALFCTP